MQPAGECRFADVEQAGNRTTRLTSHNSARSLAGEDRPKTQFDPVML
jgi:hypothetical protein